MIAERRQEIVLLQRTLTDFDYQPKTWTGALVARQGKAGEGPTTTVECRPCRGEGQRRIRGIVTVCDECKGRGVLVVDAYTERMVRTAEQEVERPRRMVRCDECGGTGRSVWWRNGDELTNTCRRCWGACLLPAPDQLIQPFRGSNGSLSAEAPELGRGDPVIACMERRQIAGSYEELGLALGCLRLEHRHLYRLDVRVFIEAEVEEDDLRIEQALALEQALGYLDRLMPEEIRVPSWAPMFEKRRREALERSSDEAAA